MDAALANASRSGARPGTYEAWYVTLAEPAQRRGFWLRYTTFNPGPGAENQEAHCALWAFSFHRDDPGLNRAFKMVLPLGRLQVDTPFRVQVGESVLDAGGCRGSIDSEQGSARWELSWSGDAPPFPFLAPPWQRLASAANIGSRPLLRISGELEFDGHSYRLDGAPGGQQHTWGRSHAEEWNWGYAAGLGHEGRGWVDGATTRVGFPLGRTVSGTALGIQLQGSDFYLNSPLRVLAAAGHVSPAGWEATANARGLRATVRVVPHPEDLVGVTYADPGGGQRICYHTEVADLSIRIEEDRTGEVVAEFAQEAAAAFEYASEHPLPGLPPKL